MCMSCAHLNAYEAALALSAEAYAQGLARPGLQLCPITSQAQATHLIR